MALVDVQAQVDSWWTGYESILTTVQDDYLTGGKTIYYQQLWSHLAPPSMKDSGQGSVTPDNMTAKPSDQTDGNSDVGIIILTPIPCRYRQDVYQSSVGIGYTVTLSFIYFGDDFEYQRVIHRVGDETWREKAWYKIELLPEP